MHAKSPFSARNGYYYSKADRGSQPQSAVYRSEQGKSIPKRLPPYALAAAFGGLPQRKRAYTVRRHLAKSKTERGSACRRNPAAPPFIRRKRLSFFAQAKAAERRAETVLYSLCHICIEILMLFSVLLLCKRPQPTVTNVNKKCRINSAYRSFYAILDLLSEENAWFQNFCRILAYRSPQIMLIFL